MRREHTAASSLQSLLIALLLVLSFAWLALPPFDALAADGSLCVWNPMSSGTSVTLFSVWGSSDTDVFAVGEGGCILHYDGSQWSLMNSGSTEVLRGVWGTGPSDVFAVGEHGTVLHFDGSSWSTGPGSPLSFNITDVWGSSPADFYAVGEKYIAHFNGSTWECTYSGAIEYNLAEIWGSSGSDIYAAGEGAKRIVDCPSDNSSPCITREGAGAVLHYDGSTWQDITVRVRPLTEVRFKGMWGSSPSDVFLVGQYAVLHFDGMNWRLAPTLQDDILVGAFDGVYAASGTSSSDVYAVGQSSAGGAIFDYDGSSWSRVNAGTIEALRGVWCSPSSDVFAVGCKGTILHGVKGFPPQIQAISTSSGSHGETLDITITGSHFTGVDTVSLGDGMTVNSLIVKSDAEMIVNVTIDNDAEPGERDASVATLFGEASLPGGFTVDKDSAMSSVMWVIIGTSVVLLISITGFALVQRRPAKS